MMEPELNIFTVFINKYMFNNFFLLNTGILRYRTKGIDNRGINSGLPKLYNDVIEEYLSNDAWLFFVHEDFEIKSSLDHIFDLEPHAVYGTFGIKMENDIPVGFGKHICSNKDGSNAVEVGIPVNDKFTDVQSLDCQCILLHTSLLRDYPELRFDENLTFDLYAEDLCIRASCNLGLPIRVFPLNFQHYSHGKITERYSSGLKYIENKYPNYGVPGSCSFIGGLAKDMEKKFKYEVQASN